MPIPPSANNSTIIIVGTMNMLSGSITIMLIIGSTIISIVGSAGGDQQQHWRQLVVWTASFAATGASTCWPAQNSAPIFRFARTVLTQISRMS